MATKIYSTAYTRKQTDRRTALPIALEQARPFREALTRLPRPAQPHARLHKGCTVRRRRRHCRPRRCRPPAAAVLAQARGFSSRLPISYVHPRVPPPRIFHVLDHPSKQFAGPGWLVPSERNKPMGLVRGRPARVYTRLVLPRKVRRQHQAEEPRDSPSLAVLDEVLVPLIHLPLARRPAATCRTAPGLPTRRAPSDARSRCG